MKTLFSHTLQFTTPAFLCGADQSRAEVRPSSIRGQLRWWFRVLGGSRESETAVFGGVHGGTTSSAVVVRVSDVKPKFEKFRPLNPNTTRMYLYYFASVSGDRKGIRVEPHAYFAPGTTYCLDVSLRHPLHDEENEHILRNALDCFVKLGSLGLRATRGCGVFSVPGDIPTKEEFEAWCRSLPSHLYVKILPGGPHRDADDAQMALGAYLQNFRRETGLKSSRPSALGFSLGQNRESSALRLRPVQVREGFLAVLVYTDMACSQSSIANRL